ncbi:ArsR/SmtB family transcription factor [Mycolicibacterium baixiangningiae]|uniref:ArsR/SmtB family transcription factor n=1 Tax=Mycolicibacterium baixiangningiae TaxID=2761578 RepID=UPI0018D16182|nr:helix-turn-helix domain-containing protein [Mycolicibacterium baixiangningiae]
MRMLHHPAVDEIMLDAVLSALADPIRRKIVCRLADDDGDQPCAAFELPVTKSTGTHHFRVLREAGVIEQRYQGTSIMSALRDADLEARFPGVLSAVLASARSEVDARP